MISDAHDAFIHALTGSMRLSLAVVIAGIVLAAVMIKGRGAPARATVAAVHEPTIVEERHPEALAEPLGAQ